MLLHPVLSHFIYIHSEKRQHIGGQVNRNENLGCSIVDFFPLSTHKVGERHMTQTNQIGRFHNAENNYYYRRWKICLECNKMHLFLPEASGRG